MIEVDVLTSFWVMGFPERKKKLKQRRGNFKEIMQINFSELKINNFLLTVLQRRNKEKPTYRDSEISEYLKEKFLIAYKENEQIA